MFIPYIVFIYMAGTNTDLELHSLISLEKESEAVSKVENPLKTMTTRQDFTTTLLVNISGFVSIQSKPNDVVVWTKTRKQKTNLHAKRERRKRSLIDDFFFCSVDATSSWIVARRCC